MEARHHYKLWNPNLNQFVAQPGLLTAGQIHALGGVVIATSEVSEEPGEIWAGPLRPPGDREAMKA